VRSSCTRTRCAASAIHPAGGRDADACYRFKEGLTEEAHKLLEQSLEAHRFSPGPLRRLNRRWAGVARRLQKRG